MTKTLRGALMAGALLSACAVASVAAAATQLPVINNAQGPISAVPTAAVPFQPNAAGAVALSTSTASANVALPSTDPTIVLQNTGSVSEYVAFGGASVQATSAGFLLAPGCTAPFYAPGATNVAALAATATGSLTVTTGMGTASAYCLGSGGGGGAITAASGAFAAGAIADLGTGATPGAYTTNGLLKAIDQALGSPFQAGGSIGNTSFGISGTLPAFAATPTFNCGTGCYQATQPVSGTVVASNLPTTVDTNTGAPSASTLRTAPATGTSASPISPTITNPASTLTLTSSTAAYTAGQLIASSATAGSISVPSFSIGNAAGAAAIPRLRLVSNDTTSTAWGGVVVQIDLWSAAPTFTNGDRGAFLPATGSASHLAAYTCTFAAVWGDGVEAECAPQVGSAPAPKLAAGSTIYWTEQATTASGVTGASKTMTLTPEIWN